ncbi:MAG: succinate dehydrogenase/fumarate reductase iron-sulfur subunit [Verrucomicrobiota bacterium]
MKLKLKIWRQKNRESQGKFETYALDNVSEDLSILEVLDVLNEQLIREEKEPVAFDHDCREGICGMCSIVVNGIPHGKKTETTSCQLHMRHFKDGETLTLEPFRARPFPVLKDLIVDRSALDKIVEAGGFISVNTGVTTDANAIPIPKETVDKAMDAAVCIGCGACVAACPNASAMLFTGAKIAHLNTLPQGKPEKDARVLKMVEAMDQAGFGNCSNVGECQAVCPKGITLDCIAKMNRDYAVASIKRLIL